MEEKTLRSCHRWFGIVLAPFLFLQTLSGVLFSFDLYRDVRSALRAPLPPGAEAPVVNAYDTLTAALHYGTGKLGYAYHLALGLGLLFLIASGVWIWVRRWKRH